MEEIEDLDQIEKLDAEVASIIEEADAIIAAKRLTLPVEAVSPKNEIKNQTNTDELEALQIELEELSHES